MSRGIILTPQCHLGVQGAALLLMSFPFCDDASCVGACPARPARPQLYDKLVYENLLCLTGSQEIAQTKVCEIRCMLGNHLPHAMRESVAALQRKASSVAALTRCRRVQTSQPNATHA